MKLHAMYLSIDGGLKYICKYILKGMQEFKSDLLYIYSYTRVQ